MALHSIDACDGYGGFDLLFRHAGLAVRTVCRVERDFHAASTLVARMEAADLDDAPLWDDLATFQGRPWRGRVHLVTAGIPCQPFSTLGQKRGVDDDRWLWGDLARVVDDVRPQLVFLENVPGIVHHGLPEILGDLAGMGFDAVWCLLGAGDIRAPHQRDRWWCLGWRRTLADPTGVDRRQLHEAIAAEDGSFDLCRHPGGGRWLGLQPTAFPPLPGDVEGWERWVADGGPQPCVRRDADGTSRGLVEQLRLGGNGLVPQVGALAFKILAKQARLDFLLP